MRLAAALGAVPSVPCSRPPLLALRCTQMQGRLEQASRSQLGAVAKVQVFIEGYGDVPTSSKFCVILENAD